MDQDQTGRGTATMKKWAVAGFLAAGIVLTGVTFGILQGRGTAEGQGRIVPVTPANYAEVVAKQPAPRQYAGSSSNCGSNCGQSVRGSCCSTPSSAAAGQGGAGQDVLQIDPALPPDKYGDFLAEVYAKKLGGPVDVEVKDYGCHQEAEVTRAGKLLKKLSISGGYVVEIG